ncbi:DUF1659 domain-containing protein [Piscibacillus salipiscarius]|uniref:DUF1659 domain-containing protein n=1 Tax=Piscibacillus salipiscarius TaxID=299480 RepID=A0ABW5QCR4_9BACI
MASQVKTSTQLQLVFNAGVDEEGKAIIRRKSYNQINMDSTPDQLFAVGEALGSLQTFTLLNIVRNESFDLNEV